MKTSNAYYVDKTLLVKEWLENISKVTLITRPRRFGKTLNMTMLREFFDITKDSRVLFEGWAVMETPCAAEMNQWPGIYLSRHVLYRIGNIFLCQPQNAHASIVNASIISFITF